MNKSEETIKPDNIINYCCDTNNTSPLSVIYVRPETNKVAYEKAILKGVSPYAKVVYMANLNGKVILKNALVLDHYASEYRFAIFGKNEIYKYPEMIKKIEDYFKIDFNKSLIVGAFEALLLLNLKQQELFDIFVEDKDFLKLYGQTIKKVKNLYVINYDMPAIIKNYNTNTNVFLIVVQFNNHDISFSEINHSIAEELKNDENAPIIDKSKFQSMDWFEQVKRTYHFSHNHIMAMFDVHDFVFRSDFTRLSFKETPLGYYLINNNIATNDQLYQLKEHPVKYITKNDKRILVNIIDEADGLSYDETIELVKSIHF